MNAKVINIESARRKTFALNDTGNAERFAEQHRGTCRYVAAWKTWMVWDGKRWTESERGEVELLCKATVYSIDRETADIVEDEDGSKRKLLRAWATKSASRQGRESMMALARAELSAAPADFDASPWLLNVDNGTIDLRTGELHPHRREDMITKVAPVAFDPDAAAPQWESFLDRIMASNADLISYLQRFVGYALAGVTSEHVLAFLYGSGANGKSVFCNALTKVLGEYATKAPQGLLYERRNGDAHPTGIASLFGARFVLCPEVKAGQQFDEALVKDLVGEDAIMARRMHEDFWSFTPTHTLFVCGNHKPVVKGSDSGIWRRIRLVPFEVTIPEAERDRHLLAKLEAESAGVLAWAVRGCLEWQRAGLAAPDAVAQATNAYRAESNPLADFFASHCEFDPEAKTPRHSLRAVYESWCREVGAEPLGFKRFGESLRAEGVTDGGTMRQAGYRSPVNAWRGVRLRDTEECGQVDLMS